MNPDGLKNLVDQATGMSDRWLFIAMLVVCGVIIAVVGKIFLKQQANLVSELRSERTKNDNLHQAHHAALVRIIGEQAAGEAAMIESTNCLAERVNVLSSMCPAISQQPAGAGATGKIQPSKTKL